VARAEEVVKKARAAHDDALRAYDAALEGRGGGIVGTAGRISSTRTALKSAQTRLTNLRAANPSHAPTPRDEAAKSAASDHQRVEAEHAAAVAKREGGAGKAAKASGERTLEQHTHEELKTQARAAGAKVGRTKAETIANIRAKQGEPAKVAAHHDIPALPERTARRANETPEQTMRRTEKDYKTLQDFSAQHRDISGERGRDAYGDTRKEPTARAKAFSQSIGQQRDAIDNEHAQAMMTHAENLTHMQTPKGDLLRQGFRDWMSGRAYLANNGHYKLYNVDEEGYRAGRSQHAAPWDRVARETFRSISGVHNNSSFHDAATRYGAAHPTEIVRVKGIQRYAEPDDFVCDERSLRETVKRTMAAAQ
jgi:hypothetical protein